MQEGDESILTAAARAGQPDLSLTVGASESAFSWHPYFAWVLSSLIQPGSPDVEESWKELLIPVFKAFKVMLFCCASDLGSNPRLLLCSVEKSQEIVGALASFSALVFGSRKQTGE